MAQYSTDFVVVGRGEFPWDMLRYDSCHPIDTRDAMSLPTPEWPLEHRREQDRYIFLRHHHERPGWLPTTGRWRSFMWTAVVQGNPLWDEAMRSRQPADAR